MFTIKHVSPEGYESLYEAIELNYAPALGLQTATAISSTTTDTVWYTCPGSKEIKSIERGFVYVTNETGATVAKYNLSDGRVGSVGAVSAQTLPDVGHFMKQDGRIG